MLYADQLQCQHIAHACYYHQGNLSKRSLSTEIQVNIQVLYHIVPLNIRTQKQAEAEELTKMMKIKGRDCFSADIGCQAYLNLQNCKREKMTKIKWLIKHYYYCFF